MAVPKTTQVRRPALRWYGGKFMLAPWIIKHLPPHRIYVEPYSGPASVLLRKSPSYSEVINDTNLELVIFFRVLQNPEQKERLIEALKVTPFAREEFLRSWEPIDDPIETARRLVVRCFMGFGTNAHNSAMDTGFRANGNKNGATPAHDWARYPDVLPAIIERLHGVVIENRPALEIIRQQDSKETLFYCDPPYVHETRGKRQCENYGEGNEMSDDDHRAMAEVLREVEGMVVLSGYHSDLYDKELFPDWNSTDRYAYADGSKERVEVLWFNDAAWKSLQQPNLFGGVEW